MSRAEVRLSATRIQSASSNSSRAGAPSDQQRTLRSAASPFSIKHKAGSRPGTRKMRSPDTPSAAASATTLSE
jgi:hypothetical protein